MVKYKIVDQESVKVVTAFVDGELYVADSSHPNFDEIVEALIDGDIDVALFDVAETVADHFEAVSERVSLFGGTVCFDGDPVDNSLTKQIVRFLKEGLDFMPLVNFFEKVSTNPEPHSREQLFKFLDKHDFAITDEGDFVAYKGVQRDGDAYKSCHSGEAIVNGEPVTGQVPQDIGDIVEMPRSKVAHNPSQACSYGLHAGTFDYASTYGSVVLAVRINPRDVVSVPHDSNDQKIRCCRYEVLDEAQQNNDSAYYVEDDVVEDEPVKPAYRTCDVKGCDAKHHGRGYCRKHYGQYVG